ncbi:MAG: metallophosphoesterase, partial [Nitrososphaera sp.]
MYVRPLHPHAALLLGSPEGKKYVAVSDLHIGIEAELASKGITLSSSLVNEMAAELKDLAGSEGADGVILLGDVKHTVGTISKQEWDEIPAFLRMLSPELEVYLVPGNHDGNIRHLVPPSVNVISSKGMRLDDTLLVHGHSMPSNVRAHVSRIVMGHLHPIFLKRGSVVSGERVWIYLHAKKEALFSEPGAVDIVVVPSFNPYLYSMGPKSYRKSISPIITRVMEDEDA